MTVENFARIVWTVFEKNDKSPKMTVSTYHFNAFAQAGALWVWNDCAKSYEIHMDNFRENSNFHLNIGRKNDTIA